MATTRQQSNKNNRKKERASVNSSIRENTTPITDDNTNTNPSNTYLNTSANNTSTNTNTNVNSNSGSTSQNSGQFSIKDTDEYKTLTDLYRSSQTGLNQANMQAQKYAQSTAQAQGFSTQGAMLQNSTELNNLYANAQAQQNINYMQEVANLENAKSQEALDLATSEIANLPEGFTIEDLEEIRNAYSGRLNQDHLWQLDRIINSYDNSNEVNATTGTPVYLKGDSINVNSIPSNYRLTDEQVVEIFGDDVADQSLGKNARTHLGYLAYLLATNPNSLNGLYINLNYGAGTPKYYYIENGNLYRSFGTPPKNQSLNISALGLYVANQGA